MKNFKKLEYVDKDGDRVEIMRNSLIGEGEELYIRIENDSYDEIPDTCGVILNKEQALELARTLMEVYA